MKATLILISLVASFSLFLSIAGSIIVSALLALWFAVSYYLFMRYFHAVTRKLLRFNRFIENNILKL